jgi:hypothetical protein
VGFTNIGVALALKTLASKGMVLTRELEDERGEPYTAFAVSQKGEGWLLANQDRLVLKTDPPADRPIPF